MRNVTAHGCNIVGVFERREVAERVRDELVQSGFQVDDVYGGHYEEQGFWDSVRDFFGSRDTSAYEDAERQGHSVVVVNCPEDAAWIDRAAAIMAAYNPIDIERQAGTESRTTASAPAEGEARIPVAEERLRVGKRREVTGGVRIYSRVTEVPVEENIALEEERVHVERRPVDAPAGPEAFREGTLEAVETSEEPVVEKEARVKEEVVVRKEAETHEAKVRDTVRQQEVEAERIDEPRPDAPRE